MGGRFEVKAALGWTDTVTAAARAGRCFEDVAVAQRMLDISVAALVSPTTFSQGTARPHCDDPPSWRHEEPTENTVQRTSSCALGGVAVSSTSSAAVLSRQVLHRGDAATWRAVPPVQELAMSVMVDGAARIGAPPVAVRLRPGLWPRSAASRQPSERAAGVEAT